MKLPIPLLLYTVSLGLLGWVGWQVYRTLPSWKDKAREAATLRGQQDAKDRIAGGQGQNTFAADWIYSVSAAPWWASFKNVNLIGKLPPPKPAEIDDQPKAPPPIADLRPLEDVIELVSLVYDGEHGGRGGNTHVIVRYKLEANVEPPEWYVRERTPPVRDAGMPANMPRDAVRGTVPPGRPANAAPQPPPVTPAPNRGGARPPTPMPASMTGNAILQSVWVDDHGDMRHSATLWPVRSNDGKVFGTIKLVRVAPDAQTAYFIRVLPPLAAEQTPPEPKEEPLLKTAVGLRQDVIEELRRLQGRAGPGTDRTAASQASPASTTWEDVAETTRVGKAWQVSRKDEKRFRENPEQLFESFSVDTYVSRSGSIRGVSFRSVDPQLAQRFGVSAGEVLIEVNGRTVESKAQAMKFGETDYRRGVRTFVTKWLSNGQVVERIYQAPDR